jgi:8-oxo-dGTP diphosphatase
MPEDVRADLAIVRAGGGLIWRRADDGTLELLLVHRPHYDDWSFPKGKCDPGESFFDAALREVMEETGCEVEVGPFLGEVRYTDHRGRPKVVRYWAMAVMGTEHEFAANDEVDELRWVPWSELPEALSYEHDVAPARRLRSALAG